jgi:transposase
LHSTMEKTLSSQANDWREGRRLRAFELKERGWKHKQIADALGVTEGAVSQWMKRAREKGVEGLRHKPPPGAPPRLSEHERGCLSFWLREPRRTGFEEIYGRVREWL